MINVIIKRDRLIEVKLVERWLNYNNKNRRLDEILNNLITDIKYEEEQQILLRNCTASFIYRHLRNNKNRDSSLNSV